LKERALDNLLAAKKHSDNRQYKYKHEILALMLARNPKDFYIDSDDGGIVGITHEPTKFKIHIPKKLVPSKVEKKIMPASSQNQQKLMNWVHAIQKGKAKGPAKINDIASSMKPTSVEHFMGRGQINKELPIKKAFEYGFLTKAQAAGSSYADAVKLFKCALELQAPTPPPAPKMEVDISKPLPGTGLNSPSGQNFPQLSKDPNTVGLIPPASPPIGQMPPNPLANNGFKSQPGTQEYAHELYLKNNDDSAIRAWTQAHPSPALQAARKATSAWQNVGKSLDNDIAGTSNIQQTGTELDNRIAGINPTFTMQTVRSSQEGKNYNSAWDDQMARYGETQRATDVALQASKGYDEAFEAQRQERLGFGQPRRMLFGGKPMPSPTSTNSITPNAYDNMDFKIKTPAGIAAPRA